MDEHIIALLNTNLRVIIPDFGAFIVRQKNPRVIVFNEFLRYNDGLLVDYISRIEDIDKEMAAARITDYAVEASKKLESGNVLKIKGLGTLIRERSGKISFSEDFNLTEVPAAKTTEERVVFSGEIPEEPEKPEESEKPEIPVEPEQKAPVITGAEEIKAGLEAPENPAVKLEKKAETVRKSTTRKTTTKKAVKPKADRRRIKKDNEKTLSTVVKGTEDTVEEVVTESKEEKIAESSIKEEISDVVRDAGPVVSEVKDMVASDDVEKTEETDEKVVDVLQAADPGQGSRIVNPVIDISKESSPPDLPKEIKYDRSRKPVNVNQILTWILVILVVNIAILGYFMYGGKSRQADAGKVPVVADTTESYDIEGIETESFAAGETEEAAAATAPAQPRSASTPSSSGAKFYIVAGCFKDEANADALVSELKAKGYSAVKFGKIDDLHAVSYSTYSTRVEAMNELEKIRREIQADAWMTIY